ncbi:unnamed protein product [Rotaria sordida]|uniref:Uncharacterized protein n=1 Tax=Rotaria sordida TaxID=392033 RepID=A0A819VDL1_9BILA|nr:unnamed protein product [Rotaria sordida]
MQRLQQPHQRQRLQRLQQLHQQHHQVIYTCNVNSTSKTYTVGFNPYVLNVGDFNNDNQLEIVVANSAVSNVGIFFGNGFGNFTAQTTFPTGIGPYAVAVGDFNKDNRLDVVANSGSATVGI